VGLSITVVVPSVVYTVCANKPFIRSVIILIVVILSVVLLIVVILSDVLLIVVILSVVMLNVVAPNHSCSRVLTKKNGHRNKIKIRCRIVTNSHKLRWMQWIVMDAMNCDELGWMWWIVMNAMNCDRCDEMWWIVMNAMNHDK
jgi:hypothetical protein